MKRGLFRSAQIPENKELTFATHQSAICSICGIATIFLLVLLITLFTSFDISFGHYGVAGSYTIDENYGKNNGDNDCIGLSITLNNRCSLIKSENVDGTTTQQYYWHVAIDYTYSNPNEEKFFGNFVSIYILKIETATEAGFSSVRTFFIDKESSNLYSRPVVDFSEGYTQYRFIKHA